MNGVHINNDLNVKYKAGTNCVMRYDKNWVHIRCSIVNCTLAKGSVNNTSMILPIGVMPTYSFQLNTVVTDSNWNPIETIAYCSINQNKNTIDAKVSSDLSNGNIAGSITVPRAFFDIA